MYVVVATIRTNGLEPDDVSDLVQRLENQGLQPQLEEPFVVIAGTASEFHAKFGVQLRHQRGLVFPTSLPPPEWLGDALRAKVKEICLSHGAVECGPHHSCGHRPPSPTVENYSDVVPVRAWQQRLRPPHVRVV